MIIKEAQNAVECFKITNLKKWIFHLNLSYLIIKIDYIKPT